MVCSSQIEVEIDAENKIEKVSFSGGCHGNLQGISRLVCGMEAGEVIRRLEGIRCGGKPTSCPAQLAQMLKEIISGALLPLD